MDRWGCSRARPGDVWRLRSGRRHRRGIRPRFARCPCSLRPGGFATPARWRRSRLRSAQHSSSLLWQLRVLAGWLPSEGVEAVQGCVLWFEIRNIEDRLAYFAGAPAEPMYELGRLGIISRRLESTGSAEDIRWLLRTSVWGDPGADDAYSMRIWLRHAWHRRARDASAEFRVWADAAAWLFSVRERLAQRPGADLLARAQPSLPSAWGWVTSVQWSGHDLWRAEQRWWEQVRDEGLRLLHRPIGSGGPVIGTLATLASSAHRIATALEAASGGATSEYVDATG